MKSGGHVDAAHDNGLAGLVMHCPLCSADVATRPVLHKGEYAYVACTACGGVRLQPFPAPALAAELYGDDYFTAAAHGGYADYAADAAIHRRNGRARIRKLGAPPEAGAAMIDIGCAYGFTMIEAKATGWTPHGVDLNAAARAAVAEHGMVAAPTVAALGLAAGSVAAVTFFQVLEHLPDPVAALREAADLLAPGGTLLIETWDRHSLIARAMKARWQQATPPSVLWLFDEGDLRRMCALAGLELVSWKRSMKWVSLGLVAGQMANRGSKVARMIGRRLQALALPYALGDLVTARVRKPASQS